MCTYFFCLDKSLGLITLTNIYQISWVGLNDRENEATFVWTDESPLDFTNWGSGGNGVDRDCIDMGTQGNSDKWSAYDCTSKNILFGNAVNPTLSPTTDPTYDPTMDPTEDPTSDPSIGPTTVPTMEPTLRPSQSPSLQSSNGNYILIPRRLNYSFAELYCNNVYQSNLASIHDGVERTEVKIYVNL